MVATVEDERRRAVAARLRAERRRPRLPAEGTQAERRPSFRVPFLITSGMIVAVFLYQAVFNFLNDGNRGTLSMLLTLGIFGCMAVSMLLRFKLWRLFSLFSLFILLGVWSLGAGYGLADLPLERAIRYMVPIFFAVWIVEHRHSISTEVLTANIALLAVLALLIGVLSPQEYLGGIPRMAPFTGRTDIEENNTGGLHASAYVASLMIIMLHQLKLLNRISGLACWGGIGFIGLLMLGWQVATPILMLNIYFLGHFYLTRKTKWWQKALIIGGILFSMVGGYAAYESQRLEVRGASDLRLENLGSGRIGTWLGRLEIIADRDPLVFLVGTGPGSDQFASALWGTAAKVSHNEFLTLLIESGLIGLIAMVGVIAYLCLRLGAVGYPLLAYLLAGSAVSNALILRPLLFSMFWIAVALAALRQDAARAALRAARAAAPPRPAMAPARPADRRRLSAAVPRRGRW